MGKVCDQRLLALFAFLKILRHRSIALESSSKLQPRTDPLKPHLKLETSGSASSTLPKPHLKSFFQSSFSSMAEVSPSSAPISGPLTTSAIVSPGREIPAIIVCLNYRLLLEHRFPSHFDNGVDTFKFLDEAKPKASRQMLTSHCVFSPEETWHITQAMEEKEDEAADLGKKVMEVTIIPLPTYF